LASQADVHYFSLRGLKPIPETIKQHVVFHILPFNINRASSRDKFLKTGLWLICLPWMALHCRWLGINLIYIEETIPLSAMIARIIFGNKVTITIADFFVNIYMLKHPIWRPLGRLINAIDLASWRRLPLVFTRVEYTKQYLAKRGCDPARIVPVYDACDFTIYHPMDRQAARSAFDYRDDHVVLVNHGYMHPNKGNDKIQRARIYSSWEKSGT